MNKKIGVKCIDINTDYCPCLLADTNDCVFCKQLQGEGICDCDWSGICILYEQKWQSKTKRMRSEESSTIRIEVETQFKIQETITPSTFHLQFAVSEPLAKSLNKVGAFVFLRNIDDPQFYDFPVGVMKVNENMVEVVVETVGPKSSRLMTARDNQIMVRGPYFNGIFGQPWIDHITCGKILLIAGGMGQPPAVSIANKLITNKNNITALLAPGKIGRIFIDKELRELGVEVHNLVSLRRDGMSMLASLLKKNPPELIVSAGPDEQHYSIISVMEKAGVNIPMAATNNATMCCGEGICGACAKQTRQGEVVRTCKVQIPFNNFMQE